MADQQFYTLITTAGKAKIANATAFGTKVNFNTLKVGDGNGNYYEPTESKTDLVHTVWSGPITSISTDPSNPNWIIIAVSIPADVGGFMIREVGIFDDTGTMIAIGKYPETYKPTSETGSTKDLTIKTILEVSNSGTIELKVDPNIIVATKQDFNALAGTGRTTETVKKNADNIASLSSQMADMAININKYGAVDDGVGEAQFSSIFSGTDNTQAFQNSINDAISKGKPLYIPKKRTGKYLISNTISINGKLDIYAEPGVVILGKIYDKTKPVFKISGNNHGTISNLVIIGSGLLPLAGIQFTKPDNQAITLFNCNATMCRHGLFVDEPECINRIRIVNCQFVSNLLWGIYADSYDGSTYGQSGPIKLTDTICNGNGVPSFLKITPQYDGITVLESTDIYGGQIYFRGFINLSIDGGQLSDHSKQNILAHGIFKNGQGLHINGTDIEDLENPVKKDGSIITDFTKIYDVDEGSVLAFLNIQGIEISGSIHTYHLQTQSLIKLSYNCQDVKVDTIDCNGPKYLVDIGSQDITQSQIIRLHYNNKISLLSPRAFSILDKSNLSLLTSIHNGIIPTSNILNNIFDHVYTIQNGKYGFQYYQDVSNPNFIDNGSYIEKNTNANIAIVSLDCTQNVNVGDARFFIEALDINNNRLGYKLVTCRGIDNVLYNKTDAFVLPNGTKKIRYGIFTPPQEFLQLILHLRF